MNPYNAYSLSTVLTVRSFLLDIINSITSHWVITSICCISLVTIICLIKKEVIRGY